MTRKTAREIAIQLSFAAASSCSDIDTLMERFFDAEHYETLGDEHPLFNDYPDDSQMEYIKRLLTLLTENKITIDDCIERYSKGWRLERISRTALSILRCAVCEILFMDEIPNAAAINEAVELDKGYDEPETVAFVNGVLGGIVRGELHAGETNEESIEENTEAVDEISELSGGELSEVSGDAAEFSDADGAV